MENLLDYLLYALFGHNVTSVIKNDGRCNGALRLTSWTISLEDSVYFTLDENDLAVIRALYEERKAVIDAEECARYKKIFDICS